MSFLILFRFVLTQLVQRQIPEQAQRLKISEEEVIKNVMLKDTVDGQFTTIGMTCSLGAIATHIIAEDIAEVATFFAAFPSAALTGQSLIASHGWCME